MDFYATLLRANKEPDNPAYSENDAGLGEILRFLPNNKTVSKREALKTLLMLHESGGNGSNPANIPFSCT